MEFRRGARRVSFVFASFALLTGCGGNSNVQSSAGGSGSSASTVWHVDFGVPAACSKAHPGAASCLARIIEGANPGSVSGWTPADFQARYKLPSQKKGAGQIVAIVDAYDNPNVASDLAAYRSNFGLGAATFVKYNQNGQQGNYPSPNGSWGVQIDLDSEMVSATCPKCTIYLVEANSANGSDLDAAEAEAVKLGAHIITNSWVCYGSSSCVKQQYFETKGVEYLAAAGEAGSEKPGAPAAFDRVAAIGGTQLTKSGSQYSETIWSGSIGGCAIGIKKPKWQSIIPNSVCAYRLTNDAAAEAGCSPGVAEYDSYGYGGWFEICGTSVATPLLAGVFGLAGNAAQQIGGRTFWLTKHHKALYKLSGQCSGYTNGRYTTCDGWGSPDGIGAF